MSTNKMRRVMVALLATVLTLPGVALAHGDDDDGHHHRHHHGHKGHWRHHGHDKWRHGHRNEVVVVREPVYVESRPAVVAPLWAPLTSGITLVLSNRW
jgi:hypothetical protein